jgi:DNA-binding Lrp family transcriptional regulator
MIDSGIIKGFRAGLSLKAVGGVLVTVNGSGNVSDIHSILEALESDGRSYKVIRAPGGFMFVEGILRDISDLDEYSGKVIDICGLNDPKILIPKMPSKWIGSRNKINPNDLSIIRSLREDCRKSFSDVAEELNISTRTVRRRLDKLISEGDIYLRAEMVPTASGDIVSFFFLYLTDGVDRDRIAHEIHRDNYPYVMSMVPISNVPGLLIANCWSDSMRKVEELKMTLQEKYPVERIDLNVLYDIHFIDCWVDREVG